MITWAEYMDVVKENNALYEEIAKLREEINEAKEDSGTKEYSHT